MKFEGTIPGVSKAPEYVDYMGPNGHWQFPVQMGQGVGFIYAVVDTFMKRGYIGKKLFAGHGVLNHGEESNWKKYTSSSKDLNLMIRNRPKEEFEFFCLEQYRTKGALSYAESWSLCMVEAPTTKLWYNKLIDRVSCNVRETITERHKERLNMVLQRLK